MLHFGTWIDRFSTYIGGNFRSFHLNQRSGRCQNQCKDIFAFQLGRNRRCGTFTLLYSKIEETIVYFRLEENDLHIYADRKWSI